MSDPVFKYRLNQECLSDEIRRAMERIRSVYPGFVVTSTNEAVDGRLTYSKHYETPCQAIDIGLETRYGRKVDPEVIQELIPQSFDIVPKSDHIHLEFDPPGPEDDGW